MNCVKTWLFHIMKHNRIDVVLMFNNWFPACCLQTCWHFPDDVGDFFFSVWEVTLELFHCSRSERGFVQAFPPDSVFWRCEPGNAEAVWRFMSPTICLPAPRGCVDFRCQQQAKNRANRLQGLKTGTFQSTTTAITNNNLFHSKMWINYMFVKCIGCNL